MTYEQLMKIAEETLLTMDTFQERLPAPLVYVLETAGGKICRIVNDDFTASLEELKQTEDTAVTKILAVWKGGAVDVPSYAFRKALLELDAANAQAKVLVATGNGYAVKSLAVMM